jgi:hypothetical protein
MKTISRQENNDLPFIAPRVSRILGLAPIVRLFYYLNLPIDRMSCCTARSGAGTAAKQMMTCGKAQAGMRRFPAQLETALSSSGG